LALRDPRTPWRAKALTVATAAYAVSPIDIIPDFILVLGFVDDAIVVSGLMWLALRLLPPAVLADCRARVDNRLAGPRRLMRGGLIALIVLWLGLAGLLAWWILG
jgi:uncharacterized membrane protein YkvA (DUF1232 family)